MDVQGNLRVQSKPGAPLKGVRASGSREQAPGSFEFPLCCAEGGFKEKHEVVDDAGRVDRSEGRGRNAVLAGARRLPGRHRVHGGGQVTYVGIKKTYATITSGLVSFLSWEPLSFRREAGRFGQDGAATSSLGERKGHYGTVKPRGKQEWKTASLWRGIFRKYGAVLCTKGNDYYRRSKTWDMRWWESVGLTAPESWVVFPTKFGGDATIADPCREVAMSGAGAAKGSRARALIGLSYACCSQSQRKLPGPCKLSHRHQQALGNKCQTAASSTIDLVKYPMKPLSKSLFYHVDCFPLCLPHRTG